MIKLLKDRYANWTDGKRLFLKAGYYPLVRKINNLGWLVVVSENKKYPKYTLIRYKDGERVG